MKVKALLLALSALVVGLLPLLSPVQLLQTAGGLLLGYALYRTGCFLWDARILYLDFRAFDDRLDRLVRERRKKPFVRLIERH